MIRYIDCMQSGEYEGALRNFYNFSNFCPVDEGYRYEMEFVEYNKYIIITVLSFSKSWYQHVLLNLVKLHAKFGHKEQALLVRYLNLVTVGMHASFSLLINTHL